MNALYIDQVVQGYDLGKGMNPFQAMDELKQTAQAKTLILLI